MERIYLKRQTDRLFSVEHTVSRQFSQATAVPGWARSGVPPGK